MVTLNLLSIVLVSSVIAGVTNVFEATAEDVVNLRWSGIGMYIKVDASKVQAKLDEYAQSSVKAPKLYVPCSPVLSGLAEGEHVVYVDFGYSSTTDFQGEVSISPWQPSFYVIVPLLSDTVEGPPHYDLLLERFANEEKALPTDDIIYPPPNLIDELVIGDSSIIVRDGGEEINMEFAVSEPCKPPSSMVRQEFDQTVVRDYFVGSHAQGLAFCSSSMPPSPDVVPHCTFMDSIRPNVEKALPNVCTVYNSPDERTCEVSINVTNITKRFRDLMLLGDGPVTLVATEQFSGNYTVGLKYPCMTH